MEIRELQIKEAKAYLEHQTSIRDKGRSNPETISKYSKWFNIHDAIFGLGANPDESLSDNKKGLVIQELNEGNGNSLFY